MSLRCALVAIACSVVWALPALAEVKSVVEYHSNEQATAEFKFKTAPAAAVDDAAAKARFTIVDGERDPHGGDVDKLNDGKLPTDEDQPAENFFFNAGTEGGRLQVDLGKAIDILQVNSYSWHPDTRGPQVYKLYGSDGAAKEFNGVPKIGTDPLQCGWKLIAEVDTRPKPGNANATGGGQYAVSIADAGGTLGSFRYLLFDMARTEDADAWGNTFYSEIDVIDAKAPAPARGKVTAPAAATQPGVIRTADGKYTITIDTTQAPELRSWVDTKLAPVVLKWYPLLVDMLPSDGYTAPDHFTIVFEKPGNGVAATSGTRVVCAVSWFKNNLDGEAVGAVVHEMVHVVQQYRRARAGSTPNPGWLVEGIADDVRWFKYEPQSHGADRIRNPAAVHYDDSYRTTANFLNWASEKYDKDLVKKLNAAMRDGKYNPDLWKQSTGKTADELGQEWKENLLAQKTNQKLPATAPANAGR